MSNLDKKLISDLGEARVVLAEPLQKYSSLRIGGPADFFYRAKTAEELVNAYITAQKYKIPVFVLGGGTNLLIGDKGIRGLTIKNESSQIRLVGMKGSKENSSTDKSTRAHTVFLSVESGVTINRLARFTLDQGLSGLEAFLGQPGTVGGAVYMNAHNAKKNIFFGDLIQRAKLLKPDGSVVEVLNDYFHFAYDQSLIQKSKEIVLSVTLKLGVGEKERLWQVAQETLDYRQKTQPSGLPSAGCAFRNIKKSDAFRLATPSYTCSAGYLLEQAGLKGKTFGGAKFSEKHANFIVNTYQAKASDVLELIRIAKEKIKGKYNLSLQEEIIQIGEF